jgi:hypothetical protein
MKALNWNTVKPRLQEVLQDIVFEAIFMSF